MHPQVFLERDERTKKQDICRYLLSLTGYYIDDCILDPIYKFLKFPTENVTFDDLMNDCLDSFFRACRDDMESTQTLEYFTEESNANNWEYLLDGNLFN